MAQSGSVAADGSAGLWQDSPSQGGRVHGVRTAHGTSAEPRGREGAPGWGQFQARAAIGGAQGPVPAAGPVSPGGGALQGSLCRAARTDERSAERRCGSRQDPGGGGAAGAGPWGAGRGAAGTGRARERGGAWSCGGGAGEEPWCGGGGGGGGAGVELWGRGAAPWGREQNHPGRDPA